MPNFEKSIDVMVRGLHRGYITKDEAESDLLYCLSLEEIQNIDSLFNKIPEPLQNGIKNRLVELSTLGFNWKPFFIGPGLNAAELEKLRIRLIAIHALLFRSEQP